MNARYNKALRVLVHLENNVSLSGISGNWVRKWNIEKDIIFKHEQKMFKMAKLQMSSDFAKIDEKPNKDFLRKFKPVVSNNLLASVFDQNGCVTENASKISLCCEEFYKNLFSNEDQNVDQIDSFLKDEECKEISTD